MKEVMFSSALVCLLSGLRKNTRSIFTKFGGNVVNEPRRMDKRMRSLFHAALAASAAVALV